MTNALPPDAVYTKRRAFKLAAFANENISQRVRVANAQCVSETEAEAIVTACHLHNFVHLSFGELGGPPELALRQFASQFGLRNVDYNPCSEDSGVSALSVQTTGAKNRYIPYTDRALSWHTDGYYNANDKQVLAWLLYCAHSASSGGANQVLDHEILYIRLRDYDSALAAALFAEDAMTIPPNEVDGRQLRPAHTGPVFRYLPQSGRLHMRYSARQHNIVWKDDEAVHEAARFISELLSNSDDFVYTTRLEAGEALLSNNVLHNRTAFRDEPTGQHRRLMYRIRFFDRIAAT